MAKSTNANKNLVVELIALNAIMYESNKFYKAGDKFALDAESPEVERLISLGAAKLAVEETADNDGFPRLN